MYSKFWPKGGLPGILHHYTETLVTFEYTTSAVSQPHSILFVGGLGDGPATTSYLADVVKGLQPTQWSLFTLALTSSYQSWGLGHLDRDTDEIAQCVRYIQDYKTSKYGAAGKIVLMGHSSGSQCVLHYLSRPNPHTSKPSFDADLEHVERPVLDGAIMQAPVSDREALLWVLKTGFGDKSPEDMRVVYDNMLAAANEAVKGGSELDAILPLSLTACIYGYNTPLSARRFLSLASPDSPQSPSEDDLFSSDLGPAQLQRTFGQVRDVGLLRNKLMALISGADQSMPDWVDKEGQLAKWKSATNGAGGPEIWDSEHSAVIPGASHALSDDYQEEPRRFLVGKVLGYLQTLQ
ncbi:hypothetical protein PLIIFM63780_006625 [Purpureocillium lilacinum]|uniref:Siderophore biosynthesis lipase/esterase n=1 Tax=Purpureocillium lilacinum TaxID=33203 RepID=A0A179FVE9_PURLI|nr:siderophore biosynthesis lipase/esterase [Purpureocillium lilacinum]GJN83079.1 hypothetical protein PLIIFM63780_006625 [Purpureocillium lilacinum]